MKIKHGSYTGNGTSQAITTDITPAFVIVKGASQIETVIKFASMPAGESVASWTAAVLTDGVTALDASSFDVGSNGLVNASGETFYWVAIEAQAGEVFTGSYTGDGLDDRSITAVGFQTDMLIIIRGGVLGGWHWRTSDYVGDLSQKMQASLAGTNRIQAFEGDGFQIGSASDINVDLATYWFVCIKDVSVRSGTFKYTGNGNDNRTITGLGFQPSFMFLKVRKYGGGPAATGVFRFLDETGDASMPIDEIEQVNYIQAFKPDGMEVGSDSAVNRSPEEVYVWALAGSQPSQISQVNIIG